jgi:AP-1 complex subunit beta-1
MSDGKYFQTTKKGEIHELKEELNSTSRDKIKEAVRLFLFNWYCCFCILI